MEQLDADVMIGPLSGDESIAVANYAKQHPDKTFVDGSAGAQDTTLKVQAPNFFRFNGDGAQWNAGLGDIAYNKLGWRKAAVVADDYSFGWTSAAGFIAEFCAAGGQVTKRVFPPLNTTDYSSYAQQMPTDVDGTFVAVGGAGLIPFLKAYEQAKGPIEAKKFIGNLFWGTPGQFEQLGPRVVGRVHRRRRHGRRPRHPGRPGLRHEHHRQVVQGHPARQGRGLGRAEHVHVRLLPEHLGSHQGPRGGQGRHHRTRRSCRTRWPRWSCPPLRHGQARREPSGHLHGLRPAALHEGRHAGGQDRVGHPERRPDLRRHVQRLDPGSGTQLPRAVRRGACRGWEVEPVKVVGSDLVEGVSDRDADPILRLRGVGRRFGGLDAVPDVDLDVGPGERRAILGPNGAGKTTLFNVISGDMPADLGTIKFLGQDVGELPAAGRTRLGMGRTYQKSRLFLGLTVEDNLYLAVLGSRAGTGGWAAGGRRRDARARAELAATVGLDRRSRASWAAISTVSSASSRSGWRGPSTRSSCSSTSRPRASRAASASRSPTSCSSSTRASR